MPSSAIISFCLFCLLLLSLSASQNIRLDVVEVSSDNRLSEVNRLLCLDARFNSLDYRYLPAFTIVANPDVPVGSVQFLLDGLPYRLENVSPYVMSGDQSGYTTPLNLPSGFHELSVIAYSRGNKMGSRIAVAKTSLIIIQGPSMQPPASSTRAPVTSAPATTTRAPTTTTRAPVTTTRAPVTTTTTTKAPMTSSPAGFRTIYDENFDLEIKSMLKTHGYWVFAWDVAGSTNLDDPDIYRRVIRQPDGSGIRIICFGNDQDYSRNGLNPRTELRLQGYQLPTGKRHRVIYRVNAPAQSNANFEMLQFMKSSYPWLQIDLLNGDYNARYFDFSRRWLKRDKIASWVPDQLLEWQIDFLQSSGSDAFIIVWLNGKEVWRRNAPNSSGSGTAWLQYGVYKAGSSGGQDRFIDVHRLAIFQQS